MMQPSQPQPPAAPGVTAEQTTTQSQNRWRDFIKLGQHIGLSLARRNLTQAASSLTFTTILAMVPLLTVVLSIFTAFPIFQDFQHSLEDFLTSKLMPDAVSSNVMEHLNEFTAKAASLTAIGSIFLFVTSVMLISTIDKAFNDIWLVKEQRPLGHRILVYWAIVTLGPLVIGASLWASSMVTRASLGYVQALPFFASVLLTVIPVILTGLAFAALFVYIPNCRVRWRDALIGGFTSAILLELLRAGFAFYITKFPTYTLIYGAFATVPLFLLWVYVSWIVVMFGATLVAIMPNIRNKNWQTRNYAGYQFTTALQLLAILWQAREQEQLGYSAAALAEAVQQDTPATGKLLQALKDIHFVVNTEVKGQELWVLACDPSQENLGPLIDLFLLDRQYAQDGLTQPLVTQLNRTLKERTDLRLDNLFENHFQTHSI